MRNSIALALFVSFLHLSGALSQGTDTMRVGAIFPLTGGAASWGEHMRQAAIMANDDLGAGKGGPLDLKFEDDELKSTKGLTAYKKLLEVDRVSAVVVFGGQSVAATAPLTDRDKIPAFMVTANPDLTRGHAQSFRHWLGSAEQVSVLVPVLKKHSIRRISVVVTVHEAMLEYVTRLRETAATDKIEITSVFEINPGENDFRTIVQKIAADKNQAVIIALLPPQISIFCKQLRDNKVSIPQYGFSNSESSAEVAAAAGAMNGLRYTAPTLSADFISRYETRFHSYPELASGNIYDIITMLGKAKLAGSKTSAELLRSIKTQGPFTGVLGNYGLNDKQEFVLKSKMKVIRDGRFIDLEE